MSELCECGSRNFASICCSPFLLGDSDPVTAEELMRSRYCAFIYQNKDYLLKTWHSKTRPSTLQFEDCRWLGLKIRSVHQGGKHDTEGWVDFVARYKIQGRAHRLEEHSHFVREAGLWVYHEAQ